MAGENKAQIYKNMAEDAQAQNNLYELAQNAQQALLHSENIESIHELKNKEKLDQEEEDSHDENDFMHLPAVQQSNNNLGQKLRSELLHKGALQPRI